MVGSALEQEISNGNKHNISIKDRQTLFIPFIIVVFYEALNILLPKMIFLLKSRFLFFSILFFALFTNSLPGQVREEPESHQNHVTQALGNLPYENRTLLSDYGGFSSSILVRNTAETQESPITFVLAAPLEAEFAVNTALTVIKKLKMDDVSINILVAFLGDEKNVLPGDLGGSSHKGLQDLLTLSDMPENWVLCYLDIKEAPEKLLIDHGYGEYIAPLDLVKPLSQVFESNEMQWSFRIRHNEIYKVGLADGPEALSIAWNSEINGFVLSGTRNKLLSIQKVISEETLADCLIDYAKTLSFSTVKNDRHYSYFTLPFLGAFFVSDGLTVALMLITIGVFLLFVLVHSARYNAILLFNIRRFFGFIWFFLLLLLLMVISLKISGLLYSLLLKTLNPLILSSADGALNYAGAGLTVLLAALVFCLPYPVLNYVNLPRKVQFYGVSSIIFIIMGLFLSVFLDLSYVPVFLWAFLFVFLGASVKNPAIIFLCVIMIPLIAFDAFVNILEVGSGKIAELIINTDWKTIDTWIAAFIISQFSLPLILLVRRGLLLLKKSKRRILDQKPKLKKRLIIIPVSMVLVLVGMIIQILTLPDVVEPERRFYTAGFDSELELGIDTVLFQDSRIISLHLEAQKKPVRFDVSIEGINDETLLPIYAAPVPFERENEGRKITFSIGENAPNPFSMEIVVPLQFTGLLTAEAIYNSWDSLLDPGEAPKTDNYILKLIKTVNLELYQKKLSTN